DGGHGRSARAPGCRAARGVRPRARRHPRRGLRRSGRARPALHHRHGRAPPPSRGPRPRPAHLRIPPSPDPGRRDLRALRGQDPREHGDRPQRDARPVGLDERSPDPLVPMGLGLRLDRRGVEARPQLRPPHVHQHPRQGSRPRLRDHARRPAAEVESGLPAAAAIQRRARRPVRVGRGGARPRSRSRPARREAPLGGLARGQGDGRQGAPPDRQGLHRLSGPLRPPRLPRHAESQCRGQRDPQRVGLRDHLLRPLPRPDVHLHRGGGRGRVARRLLRAPAARFGEHRGRPHLPRAERQPRPSGGAPPVSGHAEHPLRRDRAARPGPVRALLPALQHGSAAAAARDGAAHDRAPRVPGRRSPPEAGPLSRPGAGAGGAGADGGANCSRPGRLGARAAHRRRPGRHAAACL
ncbi:MAG: Linoleoyl-CoA desaturase, partial [uncultured Solirubrobacteraceae bacterium]